jgi:hypothetical protein
VKGNGFEALLRYDNYTPNLSDPTSDQARQRTILGLSYWFPHPGGAATAALMLDYEQVVFANFPVPPHSNDKQERIFIHGLISF